MKRPAIALIAAFPLLAFAQEHYGPYRAEVVRVIDGDTVVVDVAVWPGLTQRISLRLAGIDAPEVRTRDPEEKRAGLAAAAELEQRLSGYECVIVDGVHLGKYAGRVIGSIRGCGQNSLSLRTPTP